MYELLQIVTTILFIAGKLAESSEQHPNNYMKCQLKTLEHLRSNLNNENWYNKIVQHRWIFKSAAKSYNISKVPVEVTLMLDVHNNDEVDCNEFVLMIPYHESIQIASLTITDKLTKKTLDFEPIYTVLDPNPGCQWNPIVKDYSEWCYDENCSCLPNIYTVKLNKGVKPGESNTVLIDYILGRPFTGIGKLIKAEDVQNVLFNATSLILSYYIVNTQRTYLIVKQDVHINILSLHINTDIKQINKDTFMIGPYNSIYPLSLGEVISLQFPFPKTLDYVSRVVRTVKSNRVVEDYNIFNDSAEYKGNYSDLFIKIMKKNDAFIYDAIFPKNSTNLYFYDDVGNISSSFLIRDEEYKHVHLIPRYPLFGNWKYNFSLEYYTEFIIENENGDDILTLWLYPSLSTLFIERYTIRILLPLGSNSVNVLNLKEYKITESKESILGIELIRNVVVIEMYKLYINELKNLLTSTIKIKYNVNYFWTVKIILSLFLHIMITFILFKVLKGTIIKFNSL